MRRCYRNHDMSGSPSAGEEGASKRIKTKRTASTSHCFNLYVYVWLFFGVCVFLFFPFKHNPDKGTRWWITYSSRTWADRRERPWGSPPAAWDTLLRWSVWRENPQNGDKFQNHGVKPRKHWISTYSVTTPSAVLKSECYIEHRCKKGFFSSEDILMLHGMKENSWKKKIQVSQNIWLNSPPRVDSFYSQTAHCHFILNHVVI